jgi:uncharacterized Zn finger protein
MARVYTPVDYDEQVVCPICGPDHGILTALHGVFGGGGPGRYTMCENCGQVLSKTCDSHEEVTDVAGDQGSTGDKPV